MTTFVRTVSASGVLVLSGLTLLLGSALSACGAAEGEEGPPPFSGRLGLENPMMGSAQGGSGTQSAAPTPSAPGAASAELGAGQQGGGSPPLSGAQPSSAPPSTAAPSSPPAGNGAGGAEPGSAPGGAMMAAGSGGMPAAPVSGQPTAGQPMVETPVFTSPPVPIAPGTEAPLPQASFLTQIWSIGVEGTGPGMFSNAPYIAVDGAGNIYVADADFDGAARVHRFDAEGRFLNQWRPVDTFAIAGLAADRSGQLYLNQFNTITRYDGATGTAPIPIPLPRTDRPQSIVPTPDDGLLVVYSTALLRFDAAGELIATLDSTWAPEFGSLNNARRATMDGEGNIYVTFLLEPAVFKFSADGALLARFGAEGNGGGLFVSDPRSIAVDSRGRIYATDNGIEVFEPNGAPRALITGIFATAMLMLPGDELLLLNSTESTLSKYAVTQ